MKFASGRNLLKKRIRADSFSIECTANGATAKKAKASLNALRSLATQFRFWRCFPTFAPIIENVDETLTKPEELGDRQTLSDEQNVSLMVDSLCVDCTDV